MLSFFTQKNQSNKRAEKIMACVDIGTSKVVCLLAIIHETKGIRVIGVGHQASHGVRNGLITDIKSTEKAIARAVQSAESQAKNILKQNLVSNVIVNVPAYKAGLYTSQSANIIKGEVTDYHVQRLTSLCHSRDIRDNMEVIHKIPMGFVIDEMHNVSDPVGMVAENLKVSMLEIAIQSLFLDNVANAVEKSHLDVDFFCASSYASGLSALVDDEIDMGATVVDIGAGTSDIAVFREGKIIYADSVRIGGNHITSDISKGLTTTAAHAERIKVLYGSAIHSPSDDGDMIDIPLVGEDNIANVTQVPRSLLLGIIRPRLEEIFELIRARLVDNGLKELAGRRVVLTGGTSQMPGIQQLASHMLDKKVRLAGPVGGKSYPKDINNPAFVTALGLLHYGSHHLDEAPAVVSPYTTWSIVRQMGHWFRENW